MQLGQRDFSSGALGLVLVIHLHAGGNATAVVDHGQRTVGVDGDQNIVAIASQGFVNGVVHDLENQVVQTGAVRGVTDIHARALAHGLQPFQDLDCAFAIATCVCCGLVIWLVLFGHEITLLLQNQKLNA